MGIFATLLYLCEHTDSTFFLYEETTELKMKNVKRIENGFAEKNKRTKSPSQCLPLGAFMVCFKVFIL